MTMCAAAETEAQSVVLRADGSISISGRALRCGSVRNALDSSLPNLGISVPTSGLLVMNPKLLARHTPTVRLFVFHHECGHHHVGASELEADCWAVRRGVRGRWLSREGLAQVCRSFGGSPTTSTHPAASARCKNLERCFAAAGGGGLQARKDVPKFAPAPLPEEPPAGPRAFREQNRR
jgi:hypothetical protein